ncbi:MAG: DUF2124 domain-containing protein [Candidatus Methanomethyliaceae archaeon]|nr:DUF2124 domain-containing protein [Candidatus Methanomethyliaceae archaeon]MDD1766306.1 DUF2124 domain-containing protein [Candidatus Methanomethyliaceae archaeon]
MKEKMVDKGLAGLSRCFKIAVSAYGKGGKLLFVGSPFTCLPFAEFLSYGIRDLPFKVYFSSEGDAKRIATIVPREGFGYSLGDVQKEKDFDIVVLLGGLAMPKSLVTPKEVKRRLLEISRLDFVIAFCFQGVMYKPEWLDEFKFKYFINAELSRVTLMEETA